MFKEFVFDTKYMYKMFTVFCLGCCVQNFCKIDSWVNINIPLQIVHFGGLIRKTAMSLAQLMKKL